MKAVNAPKGLGFEPIDRELDIDDVLAECLGPEFVKRPINQRIDGVMQSARCRRIGERCHALIQPNIRSPAAYRHQDGQNL